MKSEQPARKYPDPFRVGGLGVGRLLVGYLGISYFPYGPGLLPARLVFYGGFILVIVGVCLWLMEAQTPEEEYLEDTSSSEEEEVDAT